MSDKRVFIYNNIAGAERVMPNGGKMLSRQLIERGSPLSPQSSFIASGVNALLPGAAIEWHIHPEDEEVYIIISGTGEYYDNSKTAYTVGCGDVAFCLKGEGHGLKNTGTEPLLFGAAIAR
ncbi:cupin domain-containing protein [Desulfovibrio sp. OttesenSCG-928-F07]|nr:cupin domain-containing protein [Desulfovibrio sp. OttesenSCG-928-F07]